jgi:hypothetical protein
MTLEEADALIKTCIDKMNAVYRQPVFDEWAIVKQNEKQGLVLAYSGPRIENVKRGFLDDLKHILSDMESDKNDPGLFAFGPRVLRPVSVLAEMTSPRTMQADRSGASG